MENYILRTENNELYNEEEKHVGFTFNLIEDIIENNKITSHTIIEYITDLQGFTPFYQVTYLYFLIILIWFKKE
jgi:hypothetical protein